MKSQREIDFEKERKLKKDHPKGASVFDLCPSSYFNKKNKMISQPCLFDKCDFWDYDLKKCWFVVLKREVKE